VQEAEAKPQRRDHILREIQQNHIRIKQILAELKATKPEIERITEILGEKAVLDEVGKHPLDTDLSVN